MLSRTCSLCGVIIIEYGGYNRPSYCERCGRTDICVGCLLAESNVECWIEIWSKHHCLCGDCYEQLIEEYMAKLETSIGMKGRGN